LFRVEGFPTKSQSAARAAVTTWDTQSPRGASELEFSRYSIVSNHAPSLAAGGDANPDTEGCKKMGTAASPRLLVFAAGWQRLDPFIPGQVLFYFLFSLIIYFFV